MTADLQPSIEATCGEPPFPAWLGKARVRRVVFWFIVIVLGFVQIWSHRLLVDHDGVAYLDVAENYARGAWSAAINGYYSPLYSWLIALALLLKFPRSWESTVLHLINFAGYLGAFACFEFFLRELIQKNKTRTGSEDQTTGLSEGAWHTLGLGLFLYSALYMANISGSSGQGDGSTPDIFVMLFVFLATGLLMRIYHGWAQAGTYSALGTALAFGYFAKTAIFPLSFIFMAVAGFLSLRQRKIAFLLAPLCFALIAGPWVWALSHAQGRFTFGDNGKLSYRWLVAEHANWPEWGGQTEGDQNLIHPPRLLSTDPPIYEFAAPIAGTFPLWYGSSYWLQGWKFHFSWTGQMRVLHESHINFWEILDHQKEYLVLLFVLILVQGAALAYSKAFLGLWPLWLPSIAAFAMYALVRVEPRYVAAFVVATWMGLFAAVRLPARDVVRHFANCVVLATFLVTAAGVVHGGIHDFQSVLRAAPSEQMEVAAGLRKLGISEGQSLATIGIPHDSYYWARLAGVRVITEIPSPNVNQYWFGTTATQEKVRSLFAQTGAVAIVTDVMPTEVRYQQFSQPLHLSGWEQIGNTSYFLFPLRPGASVNSAVDGRVLPSVLVSGTSKNQARSERNDTWMQ